MEEKYKPWTGEGPSEHQRLLWRKAFWKGHKQRLESMKKYYQKNPYYFAAKHKRYTRTHRAHCNWLQLLYYRRKKGKEIF